MANQITFDCQMYVSRRGLIALNLPIDAGIRRPAKIEPISYDELIDPGFRRLLVAFDTVPRPLDLVQV